jgi:hypothetical protein
LSLWHADILSPPEVSLNSARPLLVFDQRAAYAHCCTYKNLFALNAVIGYSLKVKRRWSKTRRRHLRIVTFSAFIFLYIFFVGTGIVH